MPSRALAAETLKLERTLCDLTLRIWHVDLLRYPVCQNPKRVIAIIHDSRVAEKLRCASTDSPCASY
jgi:uncharacterized protein with PhoU and TrkA domain